MRAVFLCARGRRGASSLGMATLAVGVQPGLQREDQVRQYDAMGRRRRGVALDHAVDQFVPPLGSEDGLVRADELIGCHRGRHAGEMGHAHTGSPMFLDGSISPWVPRTARWRRVQALLRVLPALSGRCAGQGVDSRRRRCRAPDKPRIVLLDVRLNPLALAPQRGQKPGSVLRDGDGNRRYLTLIDEGHNAAE